MPPIFVFDVNETLLDLSALAPNFQECFGNGTTRIEWFKEILQLTFVTTVTGAYSDFRAIGEAALKIVETRHQHPLREEQRSKILERMRHLPAHSDVAEALKRLRGAGFGLVALTNSTLEMAEMQLTNAGIRHYFEQVFSADAVRRLKPAPEPYLMVARELAAGAESLLMVAAHSWDVAGAMRAGWSAAFLARPGQVLDALTPKPNFIAQNVEDLANKVLERL